MTEVDHLPGGRERGIAIAYHVLGSISDAEDVVQEATADWLATHATTIDDPAAWAAVVTTRRAIDRLRARQRQREAYVGPWLPEPRVQPVGAHGDPADAAALADEVSFALLVVLDRLTPDQRVAFVLHDVFGEPFDRIGDVLGRTPAAARQLASRARRRVRDAAPPDDVDERTRWALLDTFTQACDDGDLAGLLELLDPDAQLVTDGGGKARAARNVVHGADHVARFSLAVWQQLGAGHWEPALVNGQPGLQADIDGHPVVGTFEVRHGRISAIHLVSNPDKLRHLPR